MIDDRELMRLHVGALFTHDARGRLLRHNEPWGGGSTAPRMFLGRTRNGSIRRYRADLSDDLVERLEALCLDEPVGSDLRIEPRHKKSYLRLLETDAPVQSVSSGPAYRFETYLDPQGTIVAVTGANAVELRGGFEDFIDEVPTAQPFLALFEKNRPASVCRSVRITPRAHEAGVETLPEFRGCGYAAAVTAGWAKVVASTGAIPLYSTSWENIASQGVGRKLGLILYGNDFSIS